MTTGGIEAARHFSRDPNHPKIYRNWRHYNRRNPTIIPFMKKFLPYCFIILAVSAPLRHAAFAAAKTTATAPKPAAADDDKSDDDKKQKEIPKKTPQNAASLIAAIKKSSMALAKATKESAPKPKDPAAKTAEAPADSNKHEEADAKTKGKHHAHLDPKKKQHRIFFTALKNVNAGVEATTKALAAKDKSYFKSMDETGKAVVELEHAIQILQIEDPHLTKPAKAIAMAYGELRANFSDIALLKKKAGKPSAEQLATATKLQSESNKILASLKELHAKAKATKNKRLLAAIDKIMHRCHDISKVKASASNAIFAKLIDDISYLQYEWYALGEISKAWYPAVYTSWQSENKIFTSYFSSYERYSFYTSTDWSWAETKIQVVDSTAFYHVELEQTEYASYEAWTASYDESTATVEYSEAQMTAETLDTETYESSVYEFEDDDDGDGLPDDIDDDDDGDGIPDDKDNDDDGDGVADDDQDGDGIPDDQDDDDDNDGIPDDQDDDDDGDGVDDEEEDDVDANEDDDDGDNDDGDNDDGGDDDEEMEADDDGGDE